MRSHICQIGFLKFGIGHYIAHLYPHLNSNYDIDVITYTHGSPGEPLVMDDPVITNNVKNYHALINPHGFQNSSDSIEKMFDMFVEKQYKLLNLHISSYTRKTSYLFIPVIEHFKRKGLKILYTMHDVLPTPENKKPTPYLQYFYNLSDAAITGNQEEETLLKSIFNYEHPTYIARHGVYTLFNRNSFTRNQALEKLGLQESQKKLLFFGILRDNKGLEDLLYAMSLLQDSSYVLIIAVSQRMGYSFEKYQKMIDDLHIADRVRLFLQDEATIEEVETYFVGTDVLILPYTAPSQSGVLNLALAFERPIIASSLFAERGEIDGKMGYIVPPHDSQALAQRITLLFAQKEAMDPVWQKNIKQYSAAHSFAETAKVYKEAIENLIT